ncbi:MAG: hypothetical protein AB1696_16220 [Planctomycetota bacterium]
MKSVAAVVWIMVGLLLIPVAEGQSKKKGKEIPTTICTRGKLIFEDDFSAKNDEWVIQESSCTWKIARGVLALKARSDSEDSHLVISRSFSVVGGLVIEGKVAIPEGKWLYIGIDGLKPEQAYGIIDTQSRAIAMRQMRKEGNVNVVTKNFPYAAGKPTVFLFEIINGVSALTANGKTVSYTSSMTDGAFMGIKLYDVRKPDGSTYVFDEIKVWEALPKDESKKKEDKGK